MSNIVNIQYPGPTNALRNARSFYDIDETREEFLQYLKNEYALYIPDYISTDKRTLFKYIKDFYQSRGSEKSFEFLFRIFFDESIQVSYPSEIMLRTSDGKWNVDKTIKVIPISGDPFTCVSKKVTGKISGATAVIDRILSYQDGENHVYELFLSTDSLTGNFQPSEYLTWGSTDSVAVLSSVTSVAISDAGTGYTKGQIVRSINGVNSGTSNTVLIQISEVNSTGGIIRANILNFGSNYTLPPTIDMTEFGNGDAVLTASVGTLFVYPGYYIGVDGQLSENIKLQDSNYYQAFSYVIQVGRSIESWREVVKKTIHPAGLALFGEVSLNTEVDGTLDMYPESLILLDVTSILWVNNNSQVIPWINNYNNQSVWVNT